MELDGAVALQQLEGRKPAPFYVCHGEYEFLSKEFASGLARLLVPDDAERHDMTQRFDWSEGEGAVDAWAEAAGTPSLFGGGQLLIVDNAHTPALRRVASPPKKAKDKDKFSNWGTYRRFERVAEDPLPEVYTIFLCHEPLRKTTALKGRRSDKFVQRVYPLLNDRGCMVGFRKLWDNQVADWIAARLRARGLSIAPDTAEFLMAWAGADLRHLAGEIEKLATFLDSGSTVDEATVRGLVTTSEDQFVYQMIDTIMSRDGNEALRLLDLSLKGNTQPLHIVASFAGVMRDIWQARWLLDHGYFKRMPPRYNKGWMSSEMARVGPAHREALAAQGAGLVDRSPFLAYHAVRRAQHLPLKTIEAIMRRLCDIDCMLKGIRRPKKGSDEILLQQLVSDLTFVVRREAAPRRRALR